MPSQVFGKIMAEQKSGVILNISSMNAFRPLTRIAAYSAAKAGVSNFTQWLAVHMAQEYSPEIRVNAIAPGFFLTEQNRFLLTDKDTSDLTPRGQTIIAHTPQGRFGTPDDLLGAIMWLVSPAVLFRHRDRRSGGWRILGVQRGLVHKVYACCKPSSSHLQVNT